MSRLLFVCAVALLFVGAEAQSPDITAPGPCVPQPWKLDFPVPAGARASLPATVPLTITLPDCSGAAQALPFGPAPFPLLTFFNGFKCKADWYVATIGYVVSWGLATLQYDTPLWPIKVNAVDEVALFTALGEWVKSQAANASSPLSGAVDASRLVVGGHSRGGKLAGLVFANQQPAVQAAYLVDPVDVTMQVPVSPKDPSAAAAMAEYGQPVGITAAGITSSCNPPAGSWPLIWETIAEDSWLTSEPGAAHMSFADAGILNIGFDNFLTCKKPRDSRPETASLTAPTMLAWLWQQLNPDSANSPLPAFNRWMEDQEADGKLSFTIKGESGGAAALAGLAPQRELVAAQR